MVNKNSNKNSNKNFKLQNSCFSPEEKIFWDSFFKNKSKKYEKNDNLKKGLDSKLDLKNIISMFIGGSNDNNDNNHENKHDNNMDNDISSQKKLNKVLADEILNIKNDNNNLIKFLVNEKENNNKICEHIIEAVKKENCDRKDCCDKLNEDLNNNKEKSKKINKLLTEGLKKESCDRKKVDEQIIKNLDQEIEDRIKNDGNLANKVASTIKDNLELNNKLNEEIVNRTNGDKNLANQIAKNTLKLESVDIDGVISLKKELLKIDNKTQLNCDNIEKLEIDLNQETEDRIKGNANLATQTSINTTNINDNTTKIELTNNNIQLNYKEIEELKIDLSETKEYPFGNECREIDNFYDLISINLTSEDKIEPKQIHLFKSLLSTYNNICLPYYCYKVDTDNNGNKCALFVLMTTQAPY